eukprot:6213549-Pleurochrysis_carterae.AAC.2
MEGPSCCASIWYECVCTLLAMFEAALANGRSSQRTRNSLGSKVDSFTNVLICSRTGKFYFSNASCSDMNFCCNNCHCSHSIICLRKITDLLELAPLLKSNTVTTILASVLCATSVKLELGSSVKR